MAGKLVKRSLGFTPKKKETFCEVLASGCTVSEAAKAVALTRRTAYNERDRDKAFADAWEDAYEAGTDVLEAEAVRRARGYTEIRINKNGKAYEVTRYSDLLLIFILKARRPEKFRDRVDVTAVTEKRHIVLNLIPIVKDEKTGRLMVVDGNESLITPLLTPGDGDNGQDD